MRGISYGIVNALRITISECSFYVQYVLCLLFCLPEDVRTVYVEIFTGIFFREIVKKLAPLNFSDFNFREYVACLILRPNFCGFHFREFGLTRQMHENSSIAQISMYTVLHTLDTQTC